MYIACFRKGSNGRHELAVNYRDEYFVRPKTVANVSENTVPLSQQQDCIREKIIIQNTKTKEKSTPKKSQKLIDTHYELIYSFLYSFV